mmetsp:Transcript_38800/g.81256  ORF Transcript_38800/g.81256 Transcript_38800/m.81256 type:complete len:395 (-) Transcript_38800:14-1198(-)
MIPSLLRRRGIPKPLRVFLPVATAIALNPSSSSIAPADGFQFAPLSFLATKHVKLAQYYVPRRLRIYPQSSSLSLDLSSTELPPNHGSSAVRSMKPSPTESKLQLLSFYRFVHIFQPENTRDNVFERLKTIPGLRGTVYVAKEGINAQFAVPVGKPLDRLLKAFGKEGDKNIVDGGCLPFDTFENNPPNMGDVVEGNTPTFDRLIVRTRNYILRDGINLKGEEDGESSLDWSDAGTELEPSEWDEQLRSPKNMQLLDCRNKYESDEGSFVSAQPLNTQTFSDTWSVLDSQVKSQSLDPSKPVYIFCTGGIRCVKVGAYLKQHLGFDDVRSLKHGIIGYDRWRSDDSIGSTGAEDEDGCSANGANNKPCEKDSLWTGDNFLFDKRRFSDTTDKES